MLLRRPSSNTWETDSGAKGAMDVTYGVRSCLRTRRFEETGDVRSSYQLHFVQS